MRNLRFLIVMGLSLGVSGVAMATCTGGGDPCNPPRNPVIGTVSATQIPMTLQNSATPNVTGSIFFFQATTLGSAQNSPTADRNTVIVLTADFTNPATANDIIGQTLKPLLASSNYNLFGKVCPPGSSLPTDAGCSAWISAGSRTTNALTNAGFDNIASADTAPRQFTARTNTSVVDQTNVLAWLATNLNSTEVGNCSFTSSVQPFPLSGTTSMTIDQNDCSTLVPNRPYTLVEHLVYDPTQNAPNFTTSVFYTQAADPVADSVTNITHCSAQLNYHNAVANPANPNDTNYSINVGGPVSSGSATQTNVIGGTGIFSDADSVTFTNLQAGQAYSPTVTALNRGGGSWRNSNPDSFSGFTTVAWGGTFSVNSIGTTSADFVASGVNTAGVTSWQIQTTPAVAGLPSGTAVDLNGTHTMTGLTPNTQYTVQIRITEASGCFSVLPITPIAFTTTPNVPLTFNLTATAPRALNATWNTNGNPAGTVYQVQYCLDAGFTTGCLNQNSAAGASSVAISASVVPETTYFAHVRALTIGGGQNSGFSNSASATTPNEAPQNVNASCSAPGGVPSQSTCNGTVTDNGPVSELRCSWSMQSGPGAVSFAPSTPQTATGGGTCPNVVATFPTNGGYVLLLTVTDTNGTGLSGTDTVNVNVGQTPTSISVAPISATVVTGNNQVFNATVRDQFGAVIAGQAVTWGVSGGGSVTSPGASTTFSATTPGGPFTLTASLPGVPSSTAAVTVVAAGPFFVTPPNLVLNPDNRTGTLSALGGDNVSGEASLIYTWTVDSPAGASVSVSPNGTNAAKNAIVTFTAAGTYVMRCTISNTLSASATTPARNLLQVLSAISVSPNNVTITVQSNQVFTAEGRDQFNNPMGLGSVAWSSTAGNVTGAGVFNSGSIGNNIRVTATQGAISGSAFVTAVDFDVSGAKAFPVPYKSTLGGTIRFDGLGSDSHIRVYTVSGRLVFSIHVTAATYDWNVRNNSGERIASGVYLYVIESPSTTKNGKLIIIQ